jgi:cation diffusion facilitator CzcD-associated flavoprotein CzcO
VLVVGVGNSGGEIASELAHAGAHVTVAVRSGANVVPLKLAGVPIQYLAFAMRGLPMAARRAIAAAVGKLTELRRGKPVLPKPSYGVLDSIPLIGFHLVDAIRAGRVKVRSGVAAFTETGVRFTDGVQEPFDDVIFATGFTPALAPLGGLVRTDAKGFALRTDRVTSADQRHLYFVGHTYDATGGLYNIRRDAGLAAERIAATSRGETAA